MTSNYQLNAAVGHLDEFSPTELVFLIDSFRRWEDPRLNETLATLVVNHKDVSVRRAAANALAETATHKSKNALLKALDDEDNFVRRQAAYALSRVPAPDVLKALRGRLASDTDGVKLACIGSLAVLEDRQAIPELHRLLKHPDQDLRRRVVWALGTIGDRSCFDTLRDMFSDKDMVLTVLESFAKLREKRAAPLVVGALSSKEVEVRRKAIQAVGAIRLESATDDLMNMLGRDDRLTRDIALALSRLKSPKLELRLIGHLRTMNDKKAPGAAMALGLMRAEGAGDVLGKAIEDGPWPLRIAALHALGDLGDPAYVAVIETYAVGGPDDLVSTAIDSLIRINAPKSNEVLMNVLLSDRKDRVRLAAVELARRREERAQGAFLLLLKSKDEDFRRMAIECLADMGADWASAPVARLLNDENQFVQVAAIRALAKLRSRVGLEALKARYEIARLTGMKDALVWALEKYKADYDLDLRPYRFELQFGK